LQQLKLQSEIGGGMSNNGDISIKNASIIGVGETGVGDINKLPKTPSMRNSSR